MSCQVARLCVSR